MKSKKELWNTLNMIKIQLIKDFLSNYKFLEIEVQGESMEPFLYDSNCVIITPLTESPCIDDILLFYDDSYQLVLHRVIDINNNEIVLLGDNADNPDIISQDKIIGKMHSKSESFIWPQKRESRDIIYSYGDFIFKLIVTNGKLMNIILEKTV